MNNAEKNWVLGVIGMVGILLMALGLSSIFFTGEAPQPMVSPGARPLRGPAPLVVQFSGVSMSGNQMLRGDTGPIVEQRWEFGDGVSTSEENPTHTYQRPGVYKASFWVKAENGEEASETLEVVVTSP